MQPKVAIFCLCLAAILPAAPVLAAEPLPDSVGVGVWQPGVRGETHHIKVDGEDIYLDGKLQQERYRPGCVLEIRDGKAVCAQAASPQAASAPKATSVSGQDAEKQALQKLEQRIESQRGTR